MTRLKICLGRTATRLALGVVVTAAAALLAVPSALATPESDAADAISQVWNAAGGPDSVIGAQDGDVYQVGAGYAQKFTDGMIFFTPDTGAHLIYGAILDKYESLGGPADSDLGFPTIDEVPGLIGDFSRVSTFSASDKPAIFWTPDTGAWAVRGAINVAWDKLGGSAGTLGVPIEDERYDGDVVSQKFTGGELSWNSATKSFTTVPAELAESLVGLEVPLDPTTLINQAWRATGGLSGPLGARQGDQTPIGSDGAAQGYAGGKIFYTPQTGAHALTGAILAKYESVGGPTSDLGLPIGTESDGGVPNSRVSAFSAPDGPVIFWTPDSGAIVVRGAINVAWNKLGAGAGKLGVPTSEQSVSGDVVTQKFSGGEISWNPTEKKFTTEPADLAADLTGLELTEAVAQAPADNGSGDGAAKGGWRWWWLAIIIPLVVLLGLLGLWASRRSGTSDRRAHDDEPFNRGYESGRGPDAGHGAVDGESGAGRWPGDDPHATAASGWPGSTPDQTPHQEFKADEDAIDTAPTRVPTESELARFSESVTASVTETPRWSADIDSGRHARIHSEDAAPLWQTPVEESDRPRHRHAADESAADADVREEMAVVAEEVEESVIADRPLSTASAVGEPEPWRPAIHLPLADPYEAPEGYVIKATTHSGLYYLPDSALYENTLPEVWFASEEVAQANGFVRAPE
ncbi:MAG: hypothetical protein KDB50_12690 [Mycobacterium sp.]|nr:hypothetical protein [Mycobacterium sp.]